MRPESRTKTKLGKSTVCGDYLIQVRKSQPSILNPTLLRCKTLNPKHYTSHPTPYSLHSTPYTLHPTPYTLHPTPTFSRCKPLHPTT